jgi:hypothetical protein
MAVILAAAAVAIDTQPGQTPYLGPFINLTLNDETCPDTLSEGATLTLKDALIEEEPRGDYIVVPNQCGVGGYFSEFSTDNYPDGEQVDPSTWRWQSQKPGRVACNCRNDFPAWLTLRGPDIANQGICDSYETAYAWLYGEPSETIKWMTIPPRYNISIPTDYSGQEFENPNPKGLYKTLICNQTNIIQRSNQ